MYNWLLRLRGYHTESNFKMVHKKKKIIIFVSPFLYLVNLHDSLYFIFPGFVVPIRISHFP